MLNKPEPSPFRPLWALKPGTVFLNHGSFGACPLHVLEQQSSLRAAMEAEPVQFLWRHYDDYLEGSRRILARFIGARSRDVVFTTNATVAVNAVVRSLKLRAGDEILTTNLDYNACHNVLVEACKAAGARLVRARIPFPLNGEDQVLDAVLRKANGRTRLAFLDHVTSNTGLVLPIEQLLRELNSRRIVTMVDGAHAPGMLPLHVSRLGCAYYTGNLHKWVCAPKGAAFLWVSESKQKAVQPAVISHGNNTPRPGFTPFQDRFDWAGTFDPTAWLCVGEAIRYMGSLLNGNWTELRQHNRNLAIQGRRHLCEALNVKAPCPEALLGSIATIPLPKKLQGRPRTSKIDKEQSELYDRFGIEVPFSRVGTKRWFRISAQLYNTPGDYEYLAEAIQRLS